jgi:16S rRNA (cytosine967-C5)-methyltransferase
LNDERYDRPYRGDSGSNSGPRRRRRPQGPRQQGTSPSGYRPPGQNPQGRPDGRPQGRPQGRPDGRPQGRPDGNRRGPRPQNRRGRGPGRPPGPRFDDPIDQQPIHPDGPNSQANAINRSRPIYGEPRGNRGRRGNDYGPGARNGPVAQRDADGPPPLPANPREAALRILHAVDTRSAFSDRLLEGAHQQVVEGGAEQPDESGRDEALLHELVKGTLRWRGRLDHVLDRVVHIGLSQVQPWVKNVLRMGAYQVMFLDRVPPHAAVDESVKLAHKYGHPGTAGLVNSVLRRLVEEKDAIEIPGGDDVASLSVWGSHPAWLVERWLARFGADATRELMLANNRAARVGLRVNLLKGTRDQLIGRLADEGVRAVPATLSPDLVWLETPHPPARLKVFRQGFATVQDESEALVARLVGPQTHERLLDLCAAPGGKSTHLAELMGDEGEVWAVERAPERAQSLEMTVERMGTHSIHVVRGDGRTYTFPMPFDRILVDAPCSGLGVLGRRADARWRKGPEVLREMPPIQLELLSAAGRRARPGGVLVYSVCSFEPEETTILVERFLRQNPSFVLESASGIVPDAVVDEQGFMSVLPHVHGCDGAFAARFRRT